MNHSSVDQVLHPLFTEKASRDSARTVLAWTAGAFLALGTACTSADEANLGDGATAAEGEETYRPPGTEAGDPGNPGENAQQPADPLCPGVLQNCDDDLATGCETDTSSDRAHCGGCNAPCHGACVDGQCSDPIQLSLAYEHSCALLGTGQVRCWGSNYNGQLGNRLGGIAGGTGLTPEQQASPVTPENVIPDMSHRPQRVELSGGAPLEGIRAITSGQHHNCALSHQGHVYCWGANHYGQLGNGTTVSSSFATQVRNIASDRNDSEWLTDVEAIGAGWEHTCAVLRNGRVVCWGNDPLGQLGRGSLIPDTSTPALRPVPMASLTNDSHLSGVKLVSGGQNHTCLSFEQGIACVGSQTSGRLGNGEETDSVRTPQAALDFDGSDVLHERVRSLSAQRWGNCALLDTGRVACWGYQGLEGRLGNGATTHSSRPTLVRTPTDDGPLEGVTQLAAFDPHACALLDSGKAVCWGWNSHYQLGIDTSIDNSDPPSKDRSPLPMEVIDPLTKQAMLGIVEIAVGTRNTCARMQDGRLLCWGRNNRGQAGAELTTTQTLAHEVSFSPAG